MRDIKFRAWHKGQNKMYPAEEMGRDELTISTDGRGFVNVSEDGPQFSEYITDMIPLQYTGMKDKNGVEIYDGDTIKCTDGADEIDMLDSNTGIGCVEWNDIYGFWSISKIENGLGDILQCGYVEIIGNIYEQESHT